MDTFLAYILIESEDYKIIDHYDFINYVHELPEHVDKPLLIIGWKLVKKLFPDQSILNYNIKNNIYWTFSKKEKRYEYDKNIINFFKIIFKNIETHIDYYFLNIFTEKYSIIKRLLNIIRGYTNTWIYYFNNSFLYILKENEKKKDRFTCIGINLEDINFINISTDKIMTKIKSGKNNRIFYNTNFMPDNIKNMIDNNIIITYLYKILS